MPRPRKTKSAVSSERLLNSIRALFNPVRNLTPQILAQQLERFDAGYLRGAALTRFPMLVSLALALLILLPGLWLLGVHLGGGVVGAWWAATLYVVGLGVILFARVRYSRWEHTAPEVGSKTPAA